MSDHLVSAHTNIIKSNGFYTLYKMCEIALYIALLLALLGFLFLFRTTTGAFKGSCCTSNSSLCARPDLSLNSVVSVQ